MTTTRRIPSNTESKQTGNGATTGYEAELWQQAEAVRLDEAIAANLEKLGFGER